MHKDLKSENILMKKTTSEFNEYIIGDKEYKIKSKKYKVKKISTYKFHMGKHPNYRHLP